MTLNNEPRMMDWCPRAIRDLSYIQGFLPKRPHEPITGKSHKIDVQSLRDSPPFHIGGQ